MHHDKTWTCVWTWMNVTTTRSVFCAFTKLQSSEKIYQTIWKVVSFEYQPEICIRKSLWNQNKIEINSKHFDPIVPSKHIFFLTCYMVFIQREGWEQEHILFIPFFVRTSLVTLVVTAIADAASTKCGHQDVISVPARFHTIKRSKKAKVKSSS